MSLETKSQKLKDIVAEYNTEWFLGNLSFLMTCIANGTAEDQLGRLSSPMRQLYFLGGLLVSSDPTEKNKCQYSNEEWDLIIEYLNEIEIEYIKIFLPKEDEDISEQWKRARHIAMPSFLSYFNQGPLNYEEQSTYWIQELYGQLDAIIENETSLRTNDFIQFYENVDKLHQTNFQSHSLGNVPLRKDWDKYSELKIGMMEGVPDEIKQLGEASKPMYTLVSDYGIICRFFAEELISANLPIEKVKNILQLLSRKRKQSDFLFYTDTKPSNPLSENPIVDIENGMFQIFEVKQVLHAIDNLLESICSRTPQSTSKLVDKKGKLLEKRIVELFELFFKKDFKKYVGYYVDGCEQDILFLWKNYAFIIEAKGYNLREPFRNPEKAFKRIKDDFDSSVGYAYEQTKRIEQKFLNKEILIITDKKGNIIQEIDTSRYENNDFSIIVNLKSFGQIQADLSLLLDIEEDCVYPWVVRFDDLEIFLLTLIAKRKNPDYFINYLLLREDLHGRIICSDECEICGGYISGNINLKLLEAGETIVTHPSLANVFDEQYRKGLGFKNEKYIEDKKNEKTIFW